jgi:hypothetical protein
LKNIKDEIHRKSALKILLSTLAMNNPVFFELCAHLRTHLKVLLPILLDQIRYEDVSNDTLLGHLPDDDQNVNDRELGLLILDRLSCAITSDLLVELRPYVTEALLENKATTWQQEESVIAALGAAYGVMAFDRNLLLAFVDSMMDRLQNCKHTLVYCSAIASLSKASTLLNREDLASKVYYAVITAMTETDRRIYTAGIQSAASITEMMLFLLKSTNQTVKQIEIFNTTVRTVETLIERLDENVEQSNYKHLLCLLSRLPVYSSLVNGNDEYDRLIQLMKRFFDFFMKKTPISPNIAYWFDALREILRVRRESFYPYVHFWIEFSMSQIEDFLHAKQDLDMNYVLAIIEILYELITNLNDDQWQQVLFTDRKKRFCQIVEKSLEKGSKKWARHFAYNTIGRLTQKGKLDLLLENGITDMPHFILEKVMPCILEDSTADYRKPTFVGTPEYFVLSNGSWALGNLLVTYVGADDDLQQQFKQRYMGRILEVMVPMLHGVHLHERDPEPDVIANTAVTMTRLFNLYPDQVGPVFESISSAICRVLYCTTEDSLDRDEVADAVCGLCAMLEYTLEGEYYDEDHLRMFAMNYLICCDQFEHDRMDLFTVLRRIRNICLVIRNYALE